MSNPSNPNIPERVSSKSKSKRCREESPDRPLAELLQERAAVNTKIKSFYKKLKPAGSFGFQYWTDRSHMLELRGSQTRIHRKISRKTFRESSELVTRREEILEDEKLNAQEEALKLEHRLVKKHSERLLKQKAPYNQATADGNAFVKLYVTSLRGLGVKNNTAEREREGNLQTKFRNEMISLYNSKSIDPQEKGLWCPVTKKFYPSEWMIAGHIFSYKHGQDLMDSIFGREMGDEPELFAPCNGILISKHIEERFGNGNLVIVPSVRDDADFEEVRKWHESPAKSYKIRVVNPEAASMKGYIPFEQRTWAELDNEELQWQSDFRPHARYLYFHYLTSMLKRAWTLQKDEAVLIDQLGKPFWGTPGLYMRKRMLRAFVKECGHEFDDIIEGGGIEDETNGSDDNALVASAEQIRFATAVIREETDSDDEAGPENDAPDEYF